MNKLFMGISFVLISLLVVGAVSAVDNENMTDEPIMTISDNDAGQTDDLKIESPEDKKEIINHEEDTLSGQNNTPDVNVEDVDITESDNVTVPFKVTDKDGHLISGEVNVTIKGENNSVSKIIKIDNGQFNIKDLIEILKVNYKWNLSDVYDIITDCANTTNGNFTLVFSGVEDIYNGMGINVSSFINGVERLINGYEVDISELMEGLGDIARGIDVANLIDGINNIINAYDLNFTDFAKAADIVMGGFDLNFNELLNRFYKGVYFDVSLLKEGWNIINREFGISNGNDIQEVMNNLGLEIPPDIPIKLFIIYYLQPTVYLSEIVDMIDEIRDFNKLTPVEFMEKLLNNPKGVDFNITEIIYKIRDSKVNMDNVENGADKIIKSINVNKNVINPIIESIKHCTFNATKVINELENMPSINISSFNASKILDAFKKIIDSVNLNTSSISNGVDRILVASRFYNPSMNDGAKKIKGSFNYNESMISNGLEKVAEGLGINISSAVTSIIKRYGYFATFPNTFAAGAYNITVEYLANENYTSSINDTARLTVSAKTSTPITLDVKVDGYDVAITGHMNSNATGFVVFVIGDYTYIVPVKNGTITFNRSISSGIYNAEAIYLGDMKFKMNNATISFTVKSQTRIVASQVSTTYGTGKTLVISLKDDKGNSVTGKTLAVTFNGKTSYKTTDAKGQVYITVANNLAPKTYPVSVSFAGDGGYVKSSGSVKVIVSKAAPKITAKKITFKKVKKVKKYTIVLKNNKGSAMKKVKVTLKVKGKTYTAKTNSKGKATFKIKKLNKKGKYTSTVKFAGNKYYKSVSKKVKITVK